MDSDDKYDDETDTRALMEHGYAVGGNEIEEERVNSSSSSENGDGFYDPPVLSPPHTMDIPSVRRPPVPVMVPADRVSTHDLPLAAPLAVVDRELFHNSLDHDPLWKAMQGIYRHSNKDSRSSASAPQ